eukprot:6193034-Pleurochrysis_carterae.AAC.2
MLLEARLSNVSIPVAARATGDRALPPAWRERWRLSARASPRYSYERVRAVALRLENSSAEREDAQSCARLCLSAANDLIKATMNGSTSWAMTGDRAGIKAHAPLAQVPSRE